MMKLLNILLTSGYLICLHFTASAQTGNIVGSWQLVKLSTCLEEAANGSEAGQNAQSASASGQVVTFKDNASGEESSPVLSSARSTNQKRFFYKFDGDMLLILDKKSQTLSDSYMVDKFSSDSLVISNVSRPCETRIFVKINGEQPN